MISRMFSAILSAALQPCAISIFNDIFHYKHMSKVNGFFVLGMYIGIASSSLSLLIDH